MAAIEVKQTQDFFGLLAVRHPFLTSQAQAAEDWTLKNEVRSSLPVGILHSLTQNVSYGERKPFAASVEQGGGMFAIANCISALEEDW
jgi:hypothetical protein